MPEVFEYPAAGKDVPQLHDELLAAGLAPLLVETRTDATEEPSDLPGLPRRVETRTAVLTYPDGQQQAPVDAVVAAHVPRARYDPPARLAEVGALQRETRRKGLRVRAARATTLADLRAVLVEHLGEEAGA